ncbi:DUF2867 domain-containing protein [Streptomyces sp. NPDC048473]|uniref:DUF2867 domain-containing protein n=1 Tax=unclassified Streptomyces TaxID=2593676 RepID=UPI00370F8080
MATPRTRRVEVPRVAAAAEEELAAGAGYASAFELPVADARSRTPEQWARAVFEDAPVLLRGFLVLGWSLVLRIRLGPRPSPGHVLGWTVSDSAADSDTGRDAGTGTDEGPGSNTTTLAAPSPLITTRNVAVVNASTVVWVTFVRFDRRIARPVWAMIAPIHHLAIPYLLRRAGRRR